MLRDNTYILFINDYLACLGKLYEYLSESINDSNIDY